MRPLESESHKECRTHKRAATFYSCYYIGHSNWLLPSSSSGSSHLQDKEEDERKMKLALLPFLATVPVAESSHLRRLNIFADNAEEHTYGNLKDDLGDLPAILASDGGCDRECRRKKRREQRNQNMGRRRLEIELTKANNGDVEDGETLGQCEGDCDDGTFQSFILILCCMYPEHSSMCFEHSPSYIFVPRFSHSFQTTNARGTWSAFSEMMMKLSPDALAAANQAGTFVWTKMTWMIMTMATTTMATTTTKTATKKN